MDLVPLLRELVAIDSTSTRTNLPIIETLQRRLVALGFSCELQRYRDDAGVEKANLIGQLGEGLPELALVGHSDCVPFDATWTEALNLTDEKDKRYAYDAEPILETYSAPGRQFFLGVRLVY